MRRTRKTLDKLQCRLMDSVLLAKRNNEEHNAASWEMQQGVLLDYEEAELFAQLLSSAKHMYGED